MSRLLGLPVDGGFGAVGTLADGFGTRRFNVPPLIEAADTGPFFHNGSIDLLEDAIAFYTSPAFAASPGRNFSGTPVLDVDQINQIGAFLRVVNALENLRQVRKRVLFVQDHRSPGNTEILSIAIADCEDAITVLETRQLGKPAVQALRTVKQTLEIARANPDAQRPAFMANALPWLAIAKGALITANPLQEF
jgi:hypothetical protein